MKNYKAPWGTLLIVVSSLTTVLCVGIAGAFVAIGHGALPWVAALPLGLLATAVLFTIRGYAVTSDAILVRRLLWTTRLPLTGLQSVQFQPDAMHGSIRAFGNGGLFSFTGFFSSRALGGYRAYVTDVHRTVVLRFASSTVVVSPSAPEEFVRDVDVAGRAP